MSVAGETEVQTPKSELPPDEVLVHGIILALQHSSDHGVPPEFVTSTDYPPSVLNDPRVVEAVSESLARYLQDGELTSFERVCQQMRVPPAMRWGALLAWLRTSPGGESEPNATTSVFVVQQLQLPEAQEYRDIDVDAAVFRLLTRYVRESNLPCVEALQQAAAIPEQTVRFAVMDVLLQRLNGLASATAEQSAYAINKLNDLVWRFSVEPQELQTAELMSAAKVALRQSPAAAATILSVFKGVPEFLHDMEVRQATPQLVTYLLENPGRFPFLVDLIDAQALLAEDLAVPELQRAAEAQCLHAFRGQDVGRVRYLTKHFSLSGEVFSSPEGREATAFLLSHLIGMNGDMEGAMNVLQEFSISQEILEHPAIRHAIEERMLTQVSAANNEAVKRLLQHFSFPANFFRDSRAIAAVAHGVAEVLERNKTARAKELIALTGLSKEDVLSGISEGIAWKIVDGDIDAALQMCDAFKLSDDERHRLASTSILTLCRKPRIPEAVAALDAFSVPPEKLPSFFERFLRFFNDESIPQHIRTSEESASIVGSKLSNIEDADIARILDARRVFRVSPFAFIHGLERNQTPADFLSLNPDVPDDAMRLLELTRDAKAVTNDIWDNILLGVERFGAPVMLAYLNRPDLSPHDAAYFFGDVIAFVDRNGVDPQAFAQNILLQIPRDLALYNFVSAHHHFAMLMDGLKTTVVADVIAGARAYGRLAQLQLLRMEFETESPLSSWKMFKKFADLKRLLDTRTALQELDTGTDLSPQLRSYVESLMFHPNISTESVEQFWKDPAGFLDIDDHHTAVEINMAKKPSNLLSLPWLGLDARELRDALVEGVLDRVQSLPPMEQSRYYGVPERGDVHDAGTLHYALRKAIGQRRSGIAGVAANPGKLFSEVNVWCKQRGVVWRELWDERQGPVVLWGMDSAMRDEIQRLVFDDQFGIRGEHEPFSEYRVRIGAKSDPSIAVAGNDTASCMPFGSGKNNVYMFNPNCAQLVVERRTFDGTWRTAAQSVVTIDHETSTATPELMEGYLSRGIHLKDLVTDADLERRPVVTCDNIEIAKSAEGHRLAEIAGCYRSFFYDYLLKHGDALAVSRARVIVGKGYTPPSGLGLTLIPNTYIPQAPMGYSDNIHAECYVLETGLPEHATHSVARLAPITVRDSVSVAVIEGKAYDDNRSLLENLHKMQNNLIGMVIANARYGRPNLSFMYRDEIGRPRAYILAYEGHGLHPDQPFVFIEDLASDRTSRLAGGEVIAKFWQAYLAHYAAGPSGYLPIHTNARDATSYRILSRQMERLAGAVGLKAKMVELGQHVRGEDTFRDVVIYIGRSEEELLQRESAYSDLRSV